MRISDVVGGSLGAAVGAMASVMAGRGTDGAFIAAVAGAALGTAAALAFHKDEPWWHNPANVRTFEDVARDDTAFREEAEKQTVDAQTEGAALRSMLQGASRPALEQACASHNATAKLESAQERWQPWKGVPATEVGQAVQNVVQELEAPHLLPTGIEKRLQSGVTAACFGLFTLMHHCSLDDPKAK
jgi:hypothetical protein